VLKTYFFLILCVLFWSGNFVLGRFVKDDVTPLELAFFRWLFVFLIVSPIVIVKYKKIYIVLKSNFLILLTLSILGISAFNTILYVGLTMTTATNALIINSSIPILILSFSFFLLKQSITLNQLIGIGISTMGVIFIILEGNIKNILLLEFNKGDIWVICSSITWALYSVYVKFKPKELNDFEFFATIVTLGLIVLFPVYLYQGYSLEKEIKLVQNNYVIFLYVSIFASSLSYYFWHYGIHTIGASKTGQFVHLMPLFGSLLAYLFLDERVQIFHMIGMVLIFLGIYLSLFYKKQLKSNNENITANTR